MREMIRTPEPFRHDAEFERQESLRRMTSQGSIAVGEAIPTADIMRFARPAAEMRHAVSPSGRAGCGSEACCQAVGPEVCSGTDRFIELACPGVVPGRMPSMGRMSACLVILAGLVVGPSGTVRGAAPDFVRDIRPLLERHCYACHSGEEAKSGLRLDVKAAAFEGGDGWGPAILPGRADESPLVRFARGDEPDLRMPPDESDVPPLAATDVARLVAWVNAGAVWPDGIDTAQVVDRADHWAFKPVRRPDPPAVRDGAWPRNEIDRFLLSRLESDGLAPSPEADRRAWIRRATFDLTGLPPTPEEVEAFVEDRSASAHERVVNRLLASPRCGERYAQHWLDVVRYADTHGYEVNTERPNAWPYRDYCIAAFNEDLPYDRFIREQIAGGEPGREASTGFLVTAAVLLPGQIGADEVSKRAARQDALHDIIANTSDAVLGLTIGCARCHDHKFDPVTARDYYSLQAFFAGVEYGERPLRRPEAIARRAAARVEERLLGEVTAAIGRLPPADHRHDEDLHAAAALERAKADLAGRVRALSSETSVFAGSFTPPHPVHLLNRGDAEQRREPLAPRSPAVFDRVVRPAVLAADAAEAIRRRALAEWLTDPRHPLTARVMVNRVWQWHFGTGLVDSANDFGRNGSPPSHPDLLDWLADEFVAGGWSVKHLHRLIMGSAAYRQAAAANPAGLARDADSRLLWRFPPRRLEAEAIRDAILAVSGRLNLEMGGRGFDFFKSRGGLSGFSPIDSFGPAGRRRMIYAHKVRMEKQDVFGAFDCPDAGQSMARRRQSTTPLQALNLFNSTFTLDEAEAFAARVEADIATRTAGGGDAAPDRVVDAIDRVFRLAYGRPPEASEVDDARAVVREHGLATLCRAIFNSNEFLFIP
jgi:hypothetical protein